MSIIVYQEVEEPIVPAPENLLMYALFDRGEQGVWYDPSDIERYTEAKGPELVANGDFAQAGASWATTLERGVITFDNGVATITRGTSNTFISQDVGLIPGRWYEITLDIIGGTSPDLRVWDFAGSLRGILRDVGKHRLVFQHINAKGHLLLAVTVAGSSVVFDNVSVRELTGLDTATMFQDALGTTPVTAVEQPVGLILDKRLGLARGPERLTDGDFANGLASWIVTGEDATHTVTATGGTVRYQSDTTTPGLTLAQAGVAVVGKTYELTVVVSNYVSGALKSDTLGGAAVVTKAGTNKTIAVSSSTAFNILRSTANVDITIESISLREILGNHASQATTTSRPVLSARKNLLTDTANMLAASWLVSGGTVAVAGDAFRFTPSASSENYKSIRRVSDQTLRAGTKFVAHILAKADGCDFATIVVGGNNGSATVDLATGAVTTYGGPNITATVGPLDSEGYRHIALVNSSAVGSGSVFYGAHDRMSDPANAAVHNGTASVLFKQPQFEIGTTATRYQRVISNTAYDTVGFPHYLRFDGVDDSLQTGNIDFTTTDKMSVVAGALKNADIGGTGVFLELGSNIATVNGSFALWLPHSGDGTPNASFSSRSATTTSYAVGTSWPAPATAVMAGVVNGTRVVLRKDGVAFASTVHTSTSYGNYPLYIGRRNNAGLPFNGHLYQLGIRGAATTDYVTQTWEKTVAKKTGVNL